MAIDSSIYFQQQSPDVFGSFERGMRLGDLIRQRNLQDQQLAEEKAVKDAYSQNVTQGPDGKMNVNRGATLSRLYKINPMKAMVQEKAWASQDQEDATKKLALQKQRTDAMHGLMWSVTPENYATKIQEGKKAGLISDGEFPDQYDPSFMRRVQMATLNASEQLGQKWKEAEFRQKERGLDIERAKAIGVRGEKRDRQIEQDVQKLSKELSGTQDLVGAVDEIEKTLGGPLEGFSVEKGSLKKNGKSVDLPGVSLPGIGRTSFYSGAARDLNSAASRVFNATLKDRSGGAVTDNELERLKTEFNEGKYNTEAELVGALQRYKRQVNTVMKNREAGYNPEVVGKYSEQGGRTSKQSGQQSSKPKTINQNGYTYILNEQTGEYE